MFRGSLSSVDFFVVHYYFWNLALLYDSVLDIFVNREMDMMLENFDRITQDSGIMGGKPCIRGMRLTVGRILSQIGAGETIEELLNDYPYLEREDVLQALQYAAWLAQCREIAIA